MSIALASFVALLAATGVMRLVELGVSWRRIARRRGDVVPEPALFPAMALLHAGLVVSPIVEVVALGRPFIPLLAAVAAVVLGVATVLRVWTLRTLGRVWNVRVLPPPADGVVSSGPYRYIRHPNYVCVMLEIAALPLVHDAWMSAIALSLFNAAVLVVRIRTEEAALMRIPAWRVAFERRARFVPCVF